VQFPVENEYSSYLSSHAGHSNAYTAPTHTNYFFECAASNEGDDNSSAGDATLSAVNGVNPSPSPFYGALDRFAQFFVEPLFLESTLDRELRAVDSENKKNLQSDQWRLAQLSRTLSNPKHPFSKFSTGNLETLRDLPEKRGVKIREKFMEFYEEHYSANLMKLVVLGKEPLDKLEEWVDQLFTAVKNKDFPDNRWDGPEEPLTTSELCTQVFAKPVMESRTLEICFPYPDEEDLYETHPSRFLGHLLGHEGPGSILAYIKEKGWANELSCGYCPLCPGTAFFDFEIRLTPEGLKHYQDILKVIFQYISLMKAEPPLRWMFDEMKTMGDVNFRFKQKSPASRFTSSVSAVMQKPLPRNWLLSGSSRLRRFDPDAIVKAMQHLRPDNCRIMVVSQDGQVDLDKTERWYGTAYKVQKMPGEMLSELEKSLQSGASGRPEELYLPRKNEFIPTRLDVEKKEVAEPAIGPKLIRNDDAVRLWWKKDDRFWVPKTNFLVTIRSPMTYATPANDVKTKLFCELVKDSLSEYAYDADISGLVYNISRTELGIEVNIGGYSDKLPVLLEKVMRSMKELKVNPERFKIIKERHSRGYKNWDYQQPYHQVGHYVRWLNYERAWINHQYASELPNIEAGDIQEFIPQILGHNHVEILAHGNLYKEDILKMADLIQTILKPRPLPQSLWHLRRNIILPPGSNFTYQRRLADPANVNHAIEYSLLIGDRTDRRLKAKAQLVAQMLQEPTFDQLRTKEQLGYVVFSGARVSNASIIYRVLIQSERDPEYLEGRIEAHLSGFQADLQKMSDSDFEAHRRSVINQKQEKLKNLGSETARLAGHIGDEYFDFNKLDCDVVELKQINKRDIQDFYAEFIDPLSKTRAKLSVHMIAQARANQEAEMSPDQQNEAVLDFLSKFLSSSGVSYDPETLKADLGKVNVTGGDPDEMVSVVKSHAKVSLPAGEADSIAEKLRQGLPSVFMALGIKCVSAKQEQQQVQEPRSEMAVCGITGKVPAVMIQNVDGWKAGLRVSEGPRPLVDLSEFEEIEAKL
jgi:insulysin